LNQGHGLQLKEMYPTNTGVTITGNLAGLPLINFDSADNVTIDGRVMNQTGQLKLDDCKIVALQILARDNDYSFN
jgi:hypothetical protein